MLVIALPLPDELVACPVCAVVVAAAAAALGAYSPPSNAAGACALLGSKFVITIPGAEDGAGITPISSLRIQL